MDQFDNPAVHITKIPVRWADFDRFGHLNNAAYIELAQEARLQWAYQEFTASGHELPSVFVRQITADYRLPILPETLSVEVETTVINVGTTSFTTRQVIKNAKRQKACIVECVQIVVDLTTSTPRAIEAHEMKVLTKGDGADHG